MTIDEIKDCKIQRGKLQRALENIRDDIIYFANAAFFEHDENKDVVESLQETFNILIETQKEGDANA